MSKRITQSFYGMLLLVSASMIVPATALASHPYHVSNAEVNFNRKTGNFEVALCVWPSDLEKGLGQNQGKSVDLDKAENLDAMMKSYIEKRFVVRPADETQEVADPTVRWIGHERDLKTAWLYFEIECDKSNSQWEIENRVFFELNEDQLNQIQLKIDSVSKIEVCRVGNPNVLADLTAEVEVSVESKRAK